VAGALSALQPEQDALAADEAALAADRQEMGDGAVQPSLAAAGAAEVRGELRTLRSAVERGTAEARRAEGRRRALQERDARLVADVDGLRRECAGAETLEVPLVDELQRVEARRRAAEEVEAAADRAHQAAATNRATWQAREEALALALDEARARAGTDAVSEVEGVLGILLDLVEVDEGWEAAFEGAAGEALSAIVVTGVEPARRALARLHRSGTTGAVLSLASLGSVGRFGPGPIDGRGQRVRDHVRTERADVAALLDVLVGDAVRVDGGWPAALDVAIANPGAVVVTRDGDRFSIGGWRVGASGTGATAAALEEARSRVSAAEAELAVRADEVAAARLAVRAAKDAEGDVVRRLDDADTRFAAASERLAHVQSERREVATELDGVRHAEATIAERLEREQARLAELDAVLPALEAEESAEAELVVARQQALAALEERAAALRDRRRDLAIRAASLQEREGFLAQRRTEVEQRLEADEQARADAQERRQRLERVLATLDRLHDLLARHRVVLDAVHEDLDGRRRLQGEVARAAAAELEDLRRRRVAAERSLEEVRERARRSELDQAEARLRLETAVEALRRDYDVDTDAAMAAECPVLPDGTTPAARARELERELRLLGPINPLALEEFTALQERHTFLEGQLEDVKTTRRELTRVVRAVDAEIQSVFAAAYADVSQHFEALFATLFPGGRGRLVLTQPEDLLNTGVEVEAKPSGKNVKKLSLLSGGERSLTALAFLFAVFRSRPSPFYVMDEVEAALDDVNLHRFLGLVAEFRQEAQLIIVSHQKRTMEAADSLYGVSMQPGGSSKVLSERISTRV
jgi:chromosome segregation protein